MPSAVIADWRPHHFAISVPDLQAAMAWYGRMLGFDFEKRVSLDAIPAQVAFLRRGDFRLEIFEAEGAAQLPRARRHPNLDVKIHGNKHLCLEVDDVATTVDRLRAAGADIAFEVEVEGHAAAFVRDCAGNLIEFVEPFPTLIP